MLIAARLTAALRWLVAALVVVFFSYMAIAVLVQVLGRYVFNYSIGWAAETATFAQVWMVLLAAGLAMRDRMHVGVDALAALLPTAPRRVLLVAIAGACCWFLWQAVTGSFPLIQIGRIQTSPAIGLPMWIPYLSLPVGLSYFALELVLSLSRQWQEVATRTAPGADGPTSGDVAA